MVVGIGTDYFLFHQRSGCVIFFLFGVKVRFVSGFEWVSFDALK